VRFKLVLIFISCCANTVSAQVDAVRFKRLSDSLKIYMYTDADKASEILKQMDFVSKVAPLSIYRVDYLNQLGASKRMARDIKSSIKLHQEAISVSRKLKLEEPILRSTFNLAVSLADAGQLDKSISIMRELEEKISKTGKDYGLRQLLYANLTSLYASLNETKSAYRYNDMLKSTMKSRKDSLSYYLMRFYLLENDKKFSETVELGKEVFTKIKEIENYYLYQFNFYLGQAYLKLNDYDNGAKHLFRAKEIAELLKVESASFYSILANYYIDTKDYNKAILYYNKLETLSIEEGSLVMHMHALNGLSVSYEKTGQFKKGLETKNQAVLLTDSLNGIERRKAILELDAKYDLKEKERTIEQQKNTNKLQKQVIKIEARRKNTLGVLLAVSLLFLGVAIYLMRVLKLSREKIEKQRNKIGDYAASLENANKTKDKLFAVISHDLRSPIASLANTLALYNDEKQSKPLQNTLMSLANIQLILSNLLNWANLQIRNSDPTFSEVNIGILLEPIITQVQTQANAKSINIITQYAHHQDAWTDEHYLQIVLRNVLTNAIKFTPENGGIRISTSQADENLKVTIRDSGVGIEAEKLAGIFDYPISKEGTSGEKGTGIGLTLSKELVEKIGGSIVIKSKAGLGTEVRISIPIKNDILINPQGKSDYSY
jgi:signal transduction histidine kinase